MVNRGLGTSKNRRISNWLTVTSPLYLLDIYKGPAIVQDVICRVMQVSEMMILRHIVHEVSADQPHQTPKFPLDKWSTQEDILESHSAIHSTAQCHGRQPIVASFCRSYELIAFHWLQTKAFFFKNCSRQGGDSGNFWFSYIFSRKQRLKPLC